MKYLYLNWSGARLFYLISIGVILTGLSIHLFLKIWTSNNTFIPLTGTLQRSDIYISADTNKPGYKIESSSQRSELIFYLHEYRKKFVLVENIRGKYKTEEFERIEAGLNRANMVTAWIKRSENDLWSPQVFQLQTDKEILLSSQAIRFKARLLAYLLLFLGLGCINVGGSLLFPDIIRHRSKNLDEIPVKISSVY